MKTGPQPPESPTVSAPAEASVNGAARALAAVWSVVSDADAARQALRDAETRRFDALEALRNALGGLVEARSELPQDLRPAWRKPADDLIAQVAERIAACEAGPSSQTADGVEEASLQRLVFDDARAAVDDESARLESVSRAWRQMKVIQRAVEIRIDDPRFDRQWIDGAREAIAWAETELADPARASAERSAERFAACRQRLDTLVGTLKLERERSHQRISSARDRIESTLRRAIDKARRDLNARLGGLSHKRETLDKAETELTEWAGAAIHFSMLFGAVGGLVGAAIIASSVSEHVVASEWVAFWLAWPGLTGILAYLGIQASYGFLYDTTAAFRAVKRARDAVEDAVTAIRPVRMHLERSLAIQREFEGGSNPQSAAPPIEPGEEPAEVERTRPVPSWATAVALVGLGFLIGLAIFVTGRKSVSPDAAASATPGDSRPPSSAAERGSSSRSRGGPTPAPAPRPIRTTPARTHAPSRPTPTPSARRPPVDWVRLDGGSYAMGTDRGRKNEGPRHRVRVGQFSLMRNEVTVAQYEACQQAGVCTRPSPEPDARHGHLCSSYFSNNANLPVTCVSNTQAERLCRWVDARLPSEEEWEFAARSGGLDHSYPWGDFTPVSCTHGVVANGSHKNSGLKSRNRGCGANRTGEVCTHPKGNSRQGVCDLAGNVWEWTQTPYRERYDDSPDHSQRAVRGGGFWSNGSQVKAVRRGKQEVSEGSMDVGFRCAKDS